MSELVELKAMPGKHVLFKVSYDPVECGDYPAGRWLAREAAKIELRKQMRAYLAKIVWC